MTCKDIMKADIQFVNEADSCLSAAQLMADSDVGFLPVCDPNSRLPLGTLTDRDLCIRLVARDKPASTRVGDVMTRQVISCQENDDVDDAREAMSENQVSRLLVLDDAGKLCGVISLSDLPRVSPEAAEQTYQAVKEPASSQPAH